MAEQINKNDYINHPDRIGGFNYYSLGETTIKQLQQNNLISSKTRKFQNKKPDAIVTDDEKDIVVYIENKDINILKLFVLTIGVNILFIRQTTMSRWHMQTFLIMTAVS